MCVGPPTLHMLSIVLPSGYSIMRIIKQYGDGITGHANMASHHYQRTLEMNCINTIFLYCRQWAATWLHAMLLALPGICCWSQC